MPETKTRRKTNCGRRPTGLYANGVTGVALLRRDGFVSLNSESGGAGEILTRPLVFSGKYLFANADAPNGGTETKLRDAAGKPIETSTFENCEGVPRGLDRCEDEMAQLRRLRTDENPPIFRRT